jgi:general secretion pathway protein D
MALLRLASLLLVLPIAIWAAAAVPADELFAQGQLAEKAGDLNRAYSFYAQAAARKPKNATYRAKADALRPMVNLLETSKILLGSAASAKLLAAESEFLGAITDQDLEETRRLLPPPRVSASSERKDFDIRGDGKAIAEQVVQAFGLTVVFDQQYQPAPNLRFHLVDASFRDALYAVETATGSFFVPVNAHVLFAANESTVKRTEFDRDAAVVIPIPDAYSIQEVQEILTAVRGTLDITRMLVDSNRRLVLIRDRASKMRVAEELFHDLARPRPQVSVEVEVLATDVTSALHYGLSLPPSLSLVAIGNVASNMLQSLPGTFFSFRKVALAVAIADANLFGVLSKSNSTSQQKGQMLMLDGQAASLHIGDKYPIATNLYLGQTSGSSGIAYTPPPSFSFEDLGLSLKITPHIHGTDEVSLDLTTEFKLLGATSFNGIPVVASTKFESKVRVREGEWAVLSGLTTESDMRAENSFPGLHWIPFLHEHTHSKEHGETLIVLKPHLVNAPPKEELGPVHWVGTETHPHSTL